MIKLGMIREVSGIQERISARRYAEKRLQHSSTQLSEGPYQGLLVRDTDHSIDIDTKSTIRRESHSKDEPKKRTIIRLKKKPVAKPSTKTQLLPNDLKKSMQTSQSQLSGIMKKSPHKGGSLAVQNQDLKSDGQQVHADSFAECEIEELEKKLEKCEREF